MIKDKRNYGIELLRLVLMFMICMLHTLGKGGILGASTRGTIQYSVFWFMEIFSYCAVDSFAIISGYTATNKPKKYEKLVDLWFQVFFYSFILTVILTLIGLNKNFSIASLIKSAFPITTNYYWYMSAYFCLFLAIPFLNPLLFSIDDKTAKKMIVYIVAFFSVMSLLKDPFYMNGGYSALWIMVLYCFGALAKKVKMFEKKNAFFLIILWLVSIISTWVLYVYFDIQIIVNYISPPILLSGFLMVLLFSKIKLKGKIISKISPLALGIYLFQLNAIIWDDYLNKAYVFIVSKNIFIGVLLVLAFSGLLFVSGLIVEFIRSKMANLLKISKLSEKIVKLIDFLVSKVTLLLK